MNISQQFNFTGKLKEDDGEKQQKATTFFFRLFNKENDSKFVTRKWNIVSDNSKPNYDATNEITYNMKILKSILCDYNKAHVLVRGGITVIAAPAIQVALKNCAPFTKCITKID